MTEVLSILTYEELSVVDLAVAIDVDGIDHHLDLAAGEKSSVAGHPFFQLVAGDAARTVDVVRQERALDTVHAMLLKIFLEK